MSKLNDKVKEFAEISKSLPDNLQVICFELLLRNHLEGRQRPSGESNPSAGEVASAAPSPVPAAAIPPAAETSGKQEDIRPTDIHVKARKFMEKHGVSLEKLNGMFFKEDGQLKPLYEDLMTTRTSESQIRVTLLLALQSALTTGEFEANTETVRQECIARKCYDGSNFSNNYNNNRSLFDFDRYAKTTKLVRLSEAGKKELADLIQELQ